MLDPEVAPAAAALDPAAANAEGSEAWKHLASRVRSAVQQLHEALDHWKETFPDTTSALASLDAAVRQEFGRRQRRLRITSLGIRRGLHLPRLEGDYISRD